MDKENEEIKATLSEAKEVKKEDKKTETNKNKYEGKIDIGITTIINIVAGFIFVVGLLIGIALFWGVSRYCVRHNIIKCSIICFVNGNIRNYFKHSCSIL